MISVRLKSLIKYIEKGDKIIDIGCDHALLDIYLVKNKIVDFLIVSDIHEGAINAGIANIKKNRLSSKIQARLGNGLEVLTREDDIDTILISGMGTSTIINILSNSYLNKIDKLILQSNNDHFELRSKVVALGFYIEAEEYFIDNKKNYINIVFKRGYKTYSSKELRYGPILIHNKEYLEFELNNCLHIKRLIPRDKFLINWKLNREINLLNKLIKNSK